ncbi:MAG: hypothetical protein WC495_01540 [Patescibacteria group bacterium]|jgi:phosphomannomutase
MLIESLSGVRGIFNSDLTEGVVRRYARAFAERLIVAQESGVAIGYDTRPSSAAISVWMIEEFLRAGISDIYNCKVASTAAMHLTPAVFKAGGAVMITASHNEPEWNGLKFMRKDGALLHPEEAEKLMNDSRGVTPGSGDTDVESVLDVSRRLQQEYVLLLLRTIGDDAKRTLAERQLHIFVDANGGAAIPYLKDFFDRLNIQITFKGSEQGKFWRTIEPKAESLAPIVDYLNIGKEDFAIAFDCDADRMEFVMPKTSAFTERGTPFVSGQYVLGCVVKAVLSSMKDPQNATVVTNNATSRIVQEIVDSYKVKLEEVDVGEINVVKRMQELDSPVGGEGSSAGGIIPPMAGRDGLMTLAVILRYLAESGKTIDEALLDLPRYTTVAGKVTVDPGRAQAVRKKLIEAMKLTCKDVRVFGDDGGVKCIPAPRQFVTFRMSKTEAGVYRVIADAKEKEDAEKLFEQGKELLQRLSAE